MKHVTPKMADRIYAVLIEMVGADSDEIHQWNFRYNMTTNFPNPIQKFGFNNGLTSRGAVNHHQLMMHIGDKFFLKMDEPNDFQKSKIEKTNEIIAKITRNCRKCSK